MYVCKGCMYVKDAIVCYKLLLSTFAYLVYTEWFRNGFTNAHVKHAAFSDSAASKIFDVKPS